MNFRKDINGMRALAVVSVVIFHFYPNILPGGFAGVDMFFVISGYLMTSIIFNGLEKNQFILLEFYKARFRRIVPALLFMIVIMSVVAYLIAPPNEMKLYVKHAISSLSFVSNAIYWTESGYFNHSSHLKWLLHTWSLSVEWQFYILYPLFILFCYKKFKLSNIKVILMCVGFGSFVTSVLLSIYRPDAAFYLLPTRAWEMLIGSFAYFYTSNRSMNESRFLVIIALFSLLLSLYFINESYLWPNFLTLIPVLATLLVIYLNLNKNTFLNNRLMQKIGTYSYSIYLWHWPILILINKIYPNDNVYLIAGIFLSVLLGALSYHCVEIINYTVKLKRNILVLSYCLVIITSAGIYLKNGLPFRLGEYQNWYSGINSISSHIVNGRKCHNQSFENSCKIEQSKAVKGEVLLIGDSHAGALAGSFYHFFKESNYNFVSHSPSGCPLISSIKKVNVNRGIHKENKRCSEYSKQINQKIKATENLTIIYSARLPMYLEGGTRFNNELGGIESGNVNYVESNKNTSLAGFDISSEIQSWADLGHKVFLIYPIPEVGWDVPNKFGFDILVYGDDRPERIKTKLGTYQARTERTYEVLDRVIGGNIHRVYPHKIFCNDRYCFVNNSNGFYYHDDDHVSVYGASLILDSMKNELLQND